MGTVLHQPEIEGYILERTDPDRYTLTKPQHLGGQTYVMKVVPTAKRPEDEVQCSCKGWIFRRECKHTRLLMNRLLKEVQAGANYKTVAELLMELTQIAEEVE